MINNNLSHHCYNQLRIHYYHTVCSTQKKKLIIDWLFSGSEASNLLEDQSEFLLIACMQETGSFIAVQ